MPEFQGNRGIAGTTGPLEGQGSHYVIREGARTLIPDSDVFPDHVFDQALEFISRRNAERSGQPSEDDPPGSDLAGRLGRAGAGLIFVSRTVEPPRLSGPIQFVVKLLDFWRLEDDDASRLLGFDQQDADHVGAVLMGREEFRGRDVRERIAHLLWIRRTLFALFRDRDTENAWLRGSHSWLDGRVPMELMLGGSMEDLLLVRDYVDTAAGV